MVGFGRKGRDRNSIYGERREEKEQKNGLILINAVVFISVLMILLDAKHKLQDFHVLYEGKMKMEACALVWQSKSRGLNTTSHNSNATLLISKRAL